jgi:hypothetical protein
LGGKAPDCAAASAALNCVKLHVNVIATKFAFPTAIDASQPQSTSVNPCLLLLADKREKAFFLPMTCQLDSQLVPPALFHRRRRCQCRSSAGTWDRLAMQRCRLLAKQTKK